MNATTTIHQADTTATGVPPVPPEAHQQAGRESRGRSFQWGREQPAKGARVRFKVYIPSCIPGGEPIANYHGTGVYLGDCADGYMTRATECSAGQNVGQTIFTRELWSDAENQGEQ